MIDVDKTTFEEEVLKAECRKSGIAGNTPE